MNINPEILKDLVEKIMKDKLKEITYNEVKKDYKVIYGGNENVGNEIVKLAIEIADICIETARKENLYVR